MSANQTMWGPFKPEWPAAVSDWRILHPYDVLTRVNFAAVLDKAVSKLNPNAIISGYKVTGL